MIYLAYLIVLLVVSIARECATIGLVSRGRPFLASRMAQLWHPNLQADGIHHYPMHSNHCLVVRYQLAYTPNLLIRMSGSLRHKLNSIEVAQSHAIASLVKVAQARRSPRSSSSIFKRHQSSMFMRRLYRYRSF